MMDNSIEPPTLSRSPGMIFAMSLFGYPGVGHFMVGARKTGIVFVVGFTLVTIGAVMETFSIFGGFVSMLKWAVDLGQGEFDPESLEVNWGRVVFWIVSTFVIWLASGLDAMRLARKRPRDPQSVNPGPPVEKRELFVPREKV